MQKHKPQKVPSKGKKINEFIKGETHLKTGSSYMWIWVAIGPKAKKILGISLSSERYMLTAERFISSLTNNYGKHSVSTDGGTWYPQPCRLGYATSYPFFIWKKFDRKIHAVYQRQNRRFR